MGTFKSIFPGADKPFSAVHGSHKEKLAEIGIMISKHSHSHRSVIFTVGSGTSVLISQGFYKVKGCESLQRASYEKQSFPQLSIGARFLWQTLLLPPRGWAATASGLSSSSSAGIGCLAGKAAHTATGRAGFVKRSSLDERRKEKSQTKGR